jgi:hypothetical protein
MSDCCQAHAEETEAVLTLVGRFMMPAQEADACDLVSLAG